jgi:hypothetical protein
MSRGGSSAMQTPWDRVLAGPVQLHTPQNCPRLRYQWLAGRPHRSQTPTPLLGQKSATARIPRLSESRKKMALVIRRQECKLTLRNDGATSSGTKAKKIRSSVKKKKLRFTSIRNGRRYGLPCVAVGSTHQKCIYRFLYSQERNAALVSMLCGGCKRVPSSHSKSPAGVPVELAWAKTWLTYQTYSSQSALVGDDGRNVTNVTPIWLNIGGPATCRSRAAHGNWQVQYTSRQLCNLTRGLIFHQQCGSYYWREFCTRFS